MSDPYYGDVFALLHCDGADTSSTFTDSGPTGILGIGAFGGDPRIDTAQSKWGGASVEFLGADTLAIDAATSAITPLAIQTGDLTLEFWVRLTAIDADHILMVDGDNTTFSAKLWIENATSKLRFTCHDGAGSPIVDIYSTGALSTGVWYHCAAVRDGTTFRLFLDGVQESTATSASTLYNTTSMGFVQFGGDSVGAGLKGHLDDIRITEGVARYTSGFTPPTEAFPDAYGPPPTVLSPASIEPTTAFGTPRRVGYVSVEEYTPSTAFGTPRLVSTVTATAVESSVAFGTAALNLDRAVAATAVAPTTAFGLAEATRSAAPQPHVADSLDPGTAFGRPVASALGVHTASGASTTSFGTPVLGLVVTAEGFSPTAFGGPTVRCLAQPSGFRSTTFGTPMRVSLATASGFSRTRFGTPSTEFSAACVAEGFAPVSFGTPSCLNSAQRARSGVFRTRWGLAQAERTAP